MKFFPLQAIFQPETWCGECRSMNFRLKFSTVLLKTMWKRTSNSSKAPVNTGVFALCTNFVQSLCSPEKFSSTQMISAGWTEDRPLQCYAGKFFLRFYGKR
jgi:hypothetical protein